MKKGTQVLLITSLLMGGLISLGLINSNFGNSQYLYLDEFFTEESNLFILNPQSYPNIGGNWTVVFKTTGVATLKIEPIDGTEFRRDISFISVKCKGVEIKPEFIGEAIIFENYYCDGASTETSKVISFGRHNLEFTFGKNTSIAHNGALYTLPRTCVDNSGATCNDNCSLRVYVCDNQSACTTNVVMTEKTGSCSDSSWYEQSFDPSSSTNWDNAEVCLKVGSNPNYFYAWARGADYGDNGEMYIFSTNDMDGDTCQEHCDCLVGQLRWNLSGEVSATSCCGDDSSEFLLEQKYYSGMDGLLDESDACCYYNTSCIDNNSCYLSGSYHDADGDGDSDYCNSTFWYDCNDDTNCPSGKTCSSNNCV